MATTSQKYQIIQKKAANDYLLLHPETDASIVQVAATGITATNVQDALVELSELISGITGGGVVTGVKGSEESTFRMGNVNITAANIGLGNVNNTSDANKPVSTAQQAALNLKEDKTNLKALAYKDSLSKSDVGLVYVTNDAQVKRSEMGVANGVATLGADGRVPTAQLPSYVDDVLEADTKSAFPTTGETGKIYVDKSTNLTYRWSGTGYVEISPSLALGETSSTAYAGDKGAKNARDIASLSARLTNTSNSLNSLEGVVDGMYTNQQIDDLIAGANGGATDASELAQEAKDIAEDALSKANTANTTITNITNGTTAVGKANALAATRYFTAVGDVTAQKTGFNGGGDVQLTMTLANSGVTAGSYSAVTVDVKGRVTAGAQMVEVGTSGQTNPSNTLAVGGLFFKQI